MGQLLSMSKWVAVPFKANRSERFSQKFEISWNKIKRLRAQAEWKTFLILLGFCLRDLNWKLKTKKTPFFNVVSSSGPNPLWYIRDVWLSRVNVWWGDSVLVFPGNPVNTDGIPLDVRTIFMVPPNEVPVVWVPGRLINLQANSTGMLFFPR